MTPEEQARKPLSPSEAAAYLKERGLNISQRTVDRMCKRGELDAFVTAGGWQRIRRSELDRWIEDHS
jgi:excisionase family DNA binding protein